MRAGSKMPGGDAGAGFGAAVGTADGVAPGRHAHLRNGVAHSQATRVDVRVSVEGRRVGLGIADDGSGFSPERADRAREDGHFGLRVLNDMATHAGGSLSIDSAPGAGTRIQLEVPVA